LANNSLKPINTVIISTNNTRPVIPLVDHHRTVNDAVLEAERVW
jgi:hypothetical protein